MMLPTAFSSLWASVLLCFPLTFSFALHLTEAHLISVISQGFNSTLTAHVEAPRRGTPDQIKEMKLRLHPEMPRVLDVLTSNSLTTVVVLSGSERSVLDEVSTPP